MPAPNRRNHGAEGLADQIAKVRHTDLIGDRRDRHVASRDRHASKWEEAASKLDSAGREDPAEPREPVETPKLTGDGDHRYFLGHCVTCDRKVFVESPKPRVPFCSRRCEQKRKAA